VVALDLETGARRWAQATGAWPLLAVSGDRAFAATTDSLLVSLDAEGSVLIRRLLAAAPAGPPVPGEGRLHVALRNGTLLALDGELRTLWERELEPPLAGSPVPSGPDVFQAAPRGRVVRFDAARGSPRGEYQHAEFLVASPGVSGSQVVVAGDGGRLIAFPREAAP
jgi:outer membrane protein assembly factor BamB